MKKLLIGAAMLAAVFAFTGCLQDLGEGSKSGTKYNKTMIVNATTDTFKDKAADAKDEKDEPAILYRRYFSELSTSKEVAAIETTITINKEESIVTAPTTKENKTEVNAVVGLAFDVHKTEKDVYDFVIVGVKPVDGKFYVERYTDIAKDKANAGETDDGFDTIDGALGEYKAIVEEEKDGWAANPIKFTEDKDGNKQFTVKIEQTTPKTYDIFINDNKVGSYNGTVVNTEAVECNGKGEDTFAEIGKWAVGGIGMYANCPEGTKLKVKYSSDKEKTHGLFIDEE